MIANAAKSFLVVYRYKTRPRYRKGRWKSAEKCFGAHDLAEALRLAKEYAETNYGAQWVIDVCSEVNPVATPRHNPNDPHNCLCEPCVSASLRRMGLSV